MATINDIIKSFSGDEKVDSKMKFLYYAVTRKNFLLILRCLSGKSRTEIAREVIDIKYKFSKCSSGLISMMKEFSLRENDFYLESGVYYYSLKDKKNERFLISFNNPRFSYDYDWSEVCEPKRYTFRRQEIFTKIDCEFIHSVLCTKCNDNEVQEEFKALKIRNTAKTEFDSLYNEK